MLDKIQVVISMALDPIQREISKQVEIENFSREQVKWEIICLTYLSTKLQVGHDQHTHDPTWGVWRYCVSNVNTLRLYRII